MKEQEIIKQAVDRFLCWKLPEDFAPDGGISFDRGVHKYEPIGTNLLTATQATQMFSHCLLDLLDELEWLNLVNRELKARWSISTLCKKLKELNDTKIALEDLRTVAEEKDEEIAELKSIITDAMNYGFEKWIVKRITACLNAK